MLELIMPKPYQARVYRPYDAAIDHTKPMVPGSTRTFLQVVRERRVSPDGRMLKVNTGSRAGERINLYPWDQMQVGDFFIFPLNGKAFYLMAARMKLTGDRRDWELAIRPWEVEDNGEKTSSIRVTLVLTEITKLKVKTDLTIGRKGVTYVDHNKRKTTAARLRKESHDRLLQKSKTGVVPIRPDVKITPTPPPETPEISEVWQGNDVDNPNYDPKRDRAALIARRLAALDESEP